MKSFSYFRNADEFLTLLPAHVKALLNTPVLDAILKQKSERGPEWTEMLKTHRDIELGNMKKCFQSKAYADARKAFVYH